MHGLLFCMGVERWRRLWCRTCYVKGVGGGGDGVRGWEVERSSVLPEFGGGWIGLNEKCIFVAARLVWGVVSAVPHQMDRREKGNKMYTFPEREGKR